MVWSVLLVRWQAFDSLRQLSHAHGGVEPVEDRFAERAEVALRLAYAVAAVGQERRWLRREHALFSQESLHAFGGLGLQSMDESKDLACAGARQALADHDLEPSFLAGRSVRSLPIGIAPCVRWAWPPIDGRKQRLGLCRRAAGSCRP